jgi:hypothetical protein
MQHSRRVDEHVLEKSRRVPDRRWDFLLAAAGGWHKGKPRPT